MRHPGARGARTLCFGDFDRRPLFFPWYPPLMVVDFSGADDVEGPSPEAASPPAQSGEYPTLRQIAILIGLLPVCFLIQASLYAKYPRLSVAASGASMILGASALIWRWRLAPGRVLLLNRAGAGVLILTAALTGLLAVLLAEVQALSAPFLPMPARFAEFLEKMSGLLAVNTPFDLLAAVVTISLLPAVSEEMMFRGLVLTGLRHRFGPVAAVAGAGALFALIHLNPWQFLPLLLIGVFISFVVHRTDSLYTGIVAHATNNLLSLAALNIGRRYAADALDPQAHLPPAVVLSALALFVAGMASFISRTKKET